MPGRDMLALLQTKRVGGQRCVTSNNKNRTGGRRSYQIGYVPKGRVRSTAKL
jgi:hypothetical protein